MQSMAVTMLVRNSLPAGDQTTGLLLQGIRLAGNKSTRRGPVSLHREFDARGVATGAWERVLGPVDYLGTGRTGIA